MSVIIGNCVKEIRLGYSEFNWLRFEIAGLFDQLFGVLYANYILSEINCSPMYLCEFHKKMLNEYIEKHNLDDDVLDFLFQTDCNGRISSKSCKKLYEIMGKEEYKYGWIVGEKMAKKYMDLEDIVFDCWKNRRQLRWY